MSLRLLFVFSYQLSYSLSTIQPETAKKSISLSSFFASNIRAPHDLRSSHLAPAHRSPLILLELLAELITLIKRNGLGAHSLGARHLGRRRHSRRQRNLFLSCHTANTLPTCRRMSPLAQWHQCGRHTLADGKNTSRHVYRGPASEVQFYNLPFAYSLSALRCYDLSTLP